MDNDRSLEVLAAVFTIVALALFVLFYFLVR